jgi:hypothetical protein
MRLLMIFVLVFVETPSLLALKQFQSAGSESFELEGDKLGESLESFVSQHPKANCVESTKTRTSCYQWAEISIFGMKAHPDPGCTPKIYSSAGCVQGLTGQFMEKRLISLSYAVSGTDKTEATAALKKKFGTPMIDTSEATLWSSGSAIASVVVGKATETSDGPVLVTVLISNPNPK